MNPNRIDPDRVSLTAPHLGRIAVNGSHRLKFIGKAGLAQSIMALRLEEAMNEHPNAALARKAWEAVAASDVDTLMRLWSPDIVWHVTGDSPWQGDHIGCEQVLDYLADVGEAGEAYDARLDDVLVSNDRVLLVCHIDARRGSKRIETDTLMLVRIEDGQMVEVWTMALDPSAFIGFYGPASTDPSSNH